MDIEIDICAVIQILEVDCIPLSNYNFMEEEKLLLVCKHKQYILFLLTFFNTKHITTSGRN